jgi:predicted nuclease of predicted toxin-antitoxin system
MARFYSNENFPILTVVNLRELGHEVVTALEAGNANQRIADESVLAYASSENRAVLTINRKHFVALHHRTPAHCGIVVCSLDADFAGQASRIHDAVSLHADLKGVLIRVNRPDQGHPGAPAAG